MAKAKPGSKSNDGVLTEVCVNCGQEYYFEDETPPSDLVCERCGNPVFRPFPDLTTLDEVKQDFNETTSRDLAPDDPGTDVAPGDLYDLNNP